MNCEALRKARLWGVVALISLVNATIVTAQSREIPESLRAPLRRIIESSVSSSILFSSQNSVSSGVIHKRNDDGYPDERFSILRFAPSWDIKSLGSEQFMPFAEVEAGLFHSVGEIPPIDGSADVNDFDSLNSRTFGGLLGARWQPNAMFSVSPAFGMYYTRTQNDHDYNSAINQKLIPTFDRELFNWKMNSMTYVPSLKLKARHEIAGYQFAVSALYAGLFSKSFNDSSSLAVLNASSSYLRLKGAVDRDIGEPFVGKPLDVELYFQHTAVYGDARVGLDAPGMYELGLGAKLDTAEVLSPARSVTLSFAYIWGEDLQGVRFGGEFGF